MIVDLSDNEGGNVISIEVAREIYIEKRCKHRKVMVDGQLSFIKCRDCKQSINPIWWITRLAQEWHRVKQMMEDYRLSRKLYEEKTRTKCEHCQRMTRVNQPANFESNLRKLKSP